MSPFVWQVDRNYGQWGGWLLCRFQEHESTPGRWVLGAVFRLT